MLRIGCDGLIAVAVDGSPISARGKRDGGADLIGVPQFESPLDKLCKARPGETVGSRRPLGVAEGEQIARLRDVRLQGEGVAGEGIARLEAK